MKPRCCKVCQDELPKAHPIELGHCQECYEELTLGIISHEPAKLYSAGRVTPVEARAALYCGEYGGDY